MKNIFNKADVDEIINRINKLDHTSTPHWGKMSVGQMLAHCNVSYNLDQGGKYPPAKGVKKWLLKTFVKPIVVGPKPYKKNSRTAPQFLQTTEKDFEKEKNLLIANLLESQKLGLDHFLKIESHSFGKLTAEEWNTMFYKHINHHLTQFGV